MDLLEFSRGPALNIALVIFVAGVLWRLSAIALLYCRHIRSEPRDGVNKIEKVKGWFQGNWIRMWPHKNFMEPSFFAFVNGYVFHIGLFIVVFLFGPHVSFIRDLTGFSWPYLQSPVIHFVSVVTLASLIAALIFRLKSPVKRLLSNFEDYFSWFVTFLPMITGVMTVGQYGARYETLLAIHILSICLLLIWFPFGKLMHAFLFVFSRGATAIRMKHRGAQL